MKNIFSASICRSSLLVAALGIAYVTAGAQPAQFPLMSRDGGGVKPNIVLTMDDSGSMTFNHMPEDRVYVGSHNFTTEMQSRSARMDPGESSSYYVNHRGTVAATRGSTNVRQKQMRSPETNTIYYNPEVWYRPWPLAAGGRMANASVSAAPRDPMNQSGTTIDLTNVRDIAQDMVWCYFASEGGCAVPPQVVIGYDRRGRPINGPGTIPYDPGLYYRLNKDAGGAYLDPTSASNYTEYSINRETTFTKFAAREDCAGSSCTQAEERQNFANWFTYYRTRHFLARGSVGEAFSELGDVVRLGWGRINKSSESSIDGVNTAVIQSGVRDFNAATKTSLFDWVYALPADGGTPLPRAMRLVGEYYKRSDSQGPWSDVPGTTNTTTDKACRRSYHLMVTDGYWNQTTTSVGNSDNTDGVDITGQGLTYKYVPVRPYQDGNSNTLADYAMEYWKTDLRTDLPNRVQSTSDNPAFWQHMVNFTVGLGVRGTLDPATDLPALTLNATDPGSKSWTTDKIDDLWHAALNSRGNYISAKDPKELATALRNSVGQALADEYREAGVATASTTLQTGNRKYVPLYKSGEWTGDIQAFALDALGQAGAQLWTAAAKLPLPENRNIYTWSTDVSPPAAVAFRWDSIGASGQAALGTVAATHTSDFVDFLRGVRTKEGDGQPFRERKGVLGDFVNSNPVLLRDAVNMGYINLPASQGGGSPYSSFLTQKAARAPVLFVGGNDGMLHAFQDTFNATSANDGKEFFAYVPRSVYPNLHKLTDKTYGTSALYHQYFVDGPLGETDAYVRAPGDATASWRNYLLGSLGAGGRAVFALDVTNSTSLDASSIRWEISNLNYSDMGYITAPIQAGVLPNGEWVAIFGNGRFSAMGNAVLFVVNLETGAAQTLTVDNAGSNGLGGVGVVRNSSGQITALYAGDMKGQLWKLEYSALAASRFSVSGGAAFFRATDSATTPQAITQGPVIFDASRGGKMVMFGTGALDTEAEALSTTVQSVYSVWDKDADSIPRPMDRSVLSVRTMTPVTNPAGLTFYEVGGTSVNWTSERGWVLDLDAISGLRTIYPPQKATAKVALISTIAPARNIVVCESSSGLGINFFFEAENGVNPNTPMYDTNGDGVVNGSDQSVVGYATNADGIDAIVRGEMGTGTGTEVNGKCPVGTRMISTQNTTGQMLVCIPDEDPSATGRTVQDRIWRRIINPPIR